MGLQGYALTVEIDTEIVSAYAACNQTVLGVVAAPGWMSLGAFFLPKDVSARLDAIVLSMDPALVVTVRLYDPTTGAPISGSSASAPSLPASETRLLSAVIALAGNKIYGIEAQAVGATGDGHNIIVRTTGLVAP